MSRRFTNINVCSTEAVEDDLERGGAAMDRVKCIFIGTAAVGFW
jgi:hypothetical protein